MQSLRCSVLLHGERGAHEERRRQACSQRRGHNDTAGVDRVRQADEENGEGKGRKDTR